MIKILINSLNELNITLFIAVSLNDLVSLLRALQFFAGQPFAACVKVKSHQGLTWFVLRQRPKR